MIKDVIFWAKVLYSFTFGRMAVKAPNVIYFLSAFPAVPEDPESREALRFIHQTLREYRCGDYGGILVVPPKKITVSQIQWAFAQLLQPGGYWTYEPNKYAVVYLVPSPSQLMRLLENEVLQELCVAECWRTKRCIISPRRFHQLRMSARREYFPACVPRSFLEVDYQASIRPIFDEARLTR